MTLIMESYICSSSVSGVAKSERTNYSNVSGSITGHACEANPSKSGCRFTCTLTDQATVRPFANTWRGGFVCPLYPPPQALPFVWSSVTWLHFIPDCCGWSGKERNIQPIPCWVVLSFISLLISLLYPCCTLLTNTTTYNSNYKIIQNIKICCPNICFLSVKSSHFCVCF